MDHLEKLGANIRRRIVDKSDTGSIELFAHENQIPKSTLSEILNGKNDPRLSTLAKICSGLEIQLYELFADPALETLVAESAGKYSPRSPHTGHSARKTSSRKSSREKSHSPRKK